eukprot:GHVU01154194.1.p1 GENE.GHVU01154194.1~~GHVU01154194.1.p1  ORF type:complete len:380 (-),score=41.72 GHVU01154194.1:426-1565(-)
MLRALGKMLLRYRAWAPPEFTIHRVRCTRDPNDGAHRGDYHDDDDDDENENESGSSGSADSDGDGDGEASGVATIVIDPPLFSSSDDDDGDDVCSPSPRKSLISGCASPRIGSRVRPASPRAVSNSLGADELTKRSVDDFTRDTSAELSRAVQHIAPAATREDDRQESENEDKEEELQEERPRIGVARHCSYRRLLESATGGGSRTRSEPLQPNDTGEPTSPPQSEACRGKPTNAAASEAGTGTAAPVAAVAMKRQRELICNDWSDLSEPQLASEESCKRIRRYQPSHVPEDPLASAATPQGEPLSLSSAVLPTGMDQTADAPLCYTYPHTERTMGLDISIDDSTPSGGDEGPTEGGSRLGPRLPGGEADRGRTESQPD